LKNTTFLLTNGVKATAHTKHHPGTDSPQTRAHRVQRYSRLSHGWWMIRACAARQFDVKSWC